MVSDYTQYEDFDYEWRHKPGDFEPFPDLDNLKRKYPSTELTVAILSFSKFDIYTF